MSIPSPLTPAAFPSWAPVASVDQAAHPRPPGPQVGVGPRRQSRVKDQSLNLIFATEKEVYWVKWVREREISFDIPYVWNLKRNDTHELTYKTERDSQT